MHTPTDKCDPLTAMVVCHQKEEPHSNTTVTPVSRFTQGQTISVQYFTFTRNKCYFLGEFQTFLLPIFVLR